LAGREFTQLCREVAEAAMYILQAETGVVTMVVEEGRFIKVVAASGPLEPIIGALVPMDHSLVGWAVTNDERVLSADMESDLRDYQVAHSPIRLKSCAIVPLRSGGIIIGSVSAYNRLDSRPFSQSDAELLRALGDLVALGSTGRVCCRICNKVRPHSAARMWNFNARHGSRVNSWQTCRMNCERR
jgi:GAF domain-containing protein